MVTSVFAGLGPMQGPMIANMLDPISNLVRRVFGA